MKRIISKVVLVILAISLFGCSGYYGSIHPSHVPLGDSEMIPFAPPHPVSLINAQDDTMTKISGDGASYDTNLHEWAHQAILLIRQWLTKNGVPVVDNAEKKLAISIVDPQVHPGLVFGTASLELTVETSEGVKKTYPAEGTARSLNRSAGYAINYSVIRLIQDETMARYLEDSK
jgi:hypothetical protein